MCCILSAGAPIEGPVDQCVLVGGCTQGHRLIAWNKWNKWDGSICCAFQPPENGTVPIFPSPDFSHYLMPAELFPPWRWRSGGKSASKRIENIEQRPYAPASLRPWGRGRKSELEEDRAIPIIGVDLLTGIAPTGNVVIGVLVLDAEGTGHGDERSRGRGRKSRIKI